ncbi:hypothetical protein E4413_15855 [Leptospira interrogans]|uniref:Uncharacterized protein n=2 Tax=Leptospira interrogans TaxID=173 RepID=M6KP10_LEPIR|nr:hypothetical protein G436_0696 [Leptospira interrogans serovar Hardjo str. Norma]EMN29522.1 hypothetical protein LEP1GSC083_2332 [Leptospira interrogans serovar Pyrogenes str. L0374]QCO36287.1 hypothetical protein E4412_02890 [Leptospira interrogans]QOI33292.1 hypothetical protein LeptoLang_02985 [Leptospira interrogans serovar Icterohaemorrhagiae]QCO42210.1 hypothetical protein E4413_15855 [Leptospira interrogans]
MENSENVFKDRHSGGVLLSSRNETLSLKERFAGSFASIFFTFTGEGNPLNFSYFWPQKCGNSYV